MSMIERVAEGIYVARFGPNGFRSIRPEWEYLDRWEREIFLVMARGAIGAMRVPTAEMIDYGWEAAKAENAAQCWRDMIDAALKG